MILSLDAKDLASVEPILAESMKKLLNRDLNQIVFKMATHSGDLFLGNYAGFNSYYIPLLTVKRNVRGALVFRCSTDLCHRQPVNQSPESIALYETLRDLTVKIATVHLGYTPQLIEKG